MPPRRKSPKKGSKQQGKKKEKSPEEVNLYIGGDGEEAAPQIVVTADVHAPPRQPPQAEVQEDPPARPTTHDPQQPRPSSHEARPRAREPRQPLASTQDDDDERVDEEEIRVLRIILDFFEARPYHYDLGHRDYKDEKKKDRELDALATTIGPSWTGK